jgi:ketosteroid isomerase-like protein
MRNSLFLAVAAIAFPGCASVATRPDIASLQRQVMESERGFARTMAERDHAAFTSFLSEEAVFFSGEMPVRGKQGVAADWRRFFEGPAAPFSWEPDRVEVIESGSLALSTGPVYDSAGKVIGRFNSIWRREAPGEWRVVFDKGSPVCPTPPED